MQFLLPILVWIQGKKKKEYIWSMRTQIVRGYKCYIMTCESFLSLKIPKGPPPGLRKFVTTESPLKTMTNVFFMLKALFVLEIFTLLSWRFGYVEKWPDNKIKVNSKIYDVTDWTTNNCDTHVAQVKPIRQLNLFN